MEIKITTTQVLKLLQVLSWIIFIGLCIEAGSILFNVCYTFFVNPANTKTLLVDADLSGLYQYDRGYFIAVALVLLIVAVLKAIMFYLIVQLFTEKKLKLSQPFDSELKGFMVKQSYLALGIGLFAHAGFKYSVWLSNQGVVMPNTQQLHIAGADVWLFMAVVLFVIVQLVKRGIELQTENDLTI
ncbi:MAG TPA: DUF2975 domain-containing protein [Phnomibacter sp.]|nr:DUF2975 domain-containing protein [Phnomibacter sp.]